MPWAWQRSEVLDRRTCDKCARLHGKRRSTPQGQLHPRCRGTEVLCWVALGVVTKSEGTAPMRLLRAEQESRSMLRALIDSAANTGPALRLALGQGLLATRRGARLAGRQALVAEVTKLRPKLDPSTLLRLKADRRDLRQARRDAAKLSLWWAAAAALLVTKHHYDKKRAREAATDALKARAEGALIDSNAQAFNDERIKAAPELRRLKVRAT